MSKLLQHIQRFHLSNELLQIRVVSGGDGPINTLGRNQYPTFFDVTKRTSVLYILPKSREVVVGIVVDVVKLMI